MIVKRKASNHEEEKLNIVGEVNGCDAIIGITDVSLVIVTIVIDTH